ncbi:hypothetical protein K7X08_036375 [Anisodus acutangulus]|uniref:Uncharacterized protein n=1 Tax=Anisodus acutangulus TaxID=402998 RepID=A0A9Q1QUT4_9SOLA|nr:hypothetical protein K7X08_036375 [Anisodus acutangulus]
MNKINSCFRCWLSQRKLFQVFLPVPVLQVLQVVQPSVEATESNSCATGAPSSKQDFLPREAVQRVHFLSVVLGKIIPSNIYHLLNKSKMMLSNINRSISNSTTVEILS